MFATIVAAGALAFTALSDLLVDTQEQTNARFLNIQEQMGEDVQRRTRAWSS